MLTSTTKVFGNNSKFLPQSPFPLGHPRKNHPITLCQLSSRLYQEALLPPKSIINVGALAGLQLLFGYRHLSESMPPGLYSQAGTGHLWQVCWLPLICTLQGEGGTQLTLHFLELSVSKGLSQIQMLAESHWECPAFQLMRASVGHVCLFPSTRLPV